MSKFEDHSKDRRFCDIKVVERLQNGAKNPFKNVKKYSAMDYFKVKKEKGLKLPLRLRLGGSY